MSDFNPNSKISIIEFAKKLKGQTLRQACGEEIKRHNYKGKGNYGQILEKFYFGYEPNSNAEPDFKEAGLELKTSAVKALKKGGFNAKERISLNIINFLEVCEETFETSSFWKKNSHLLLVFYLYSKEKDLLDYGIKLVDDWEYPAADLEVIRQDWELINHKIKTGKAHELSEGDTFYLGACTKGANALSSFRSQPFNKVDAKQRAFSLKRGYVDHIIASISGNEKAIYGKIIERPEVLTNDTSIEDVVLSKFKPFYGKSIEDIQVKLGIKLNSKSKNFTASLTNAILGIEARKKIEEFEKADIRVKAVRLKENEIPKEHISFPSFEYDEIVQVDWEDCAFKNILESKFFFVFFQIDGKKLVLKKATFWNMPHSDILMAKQVWEKTVATIREGKIVKVVKNTKSGKRRFTHFPKPNENKVSHVRPHAKNSADTYDLPYSDRLTKVTEYTKHCFWLNKEYVRDEIFLKK